MAIAPQVHLQAKRLTALDFNWDWSPFPAAPLVFLSLLAWALAPCKYEEHQHQARLV